ncbi:MMPL family transporter [Actinomadura atramentaria]|uniref:MMPL family transporter n=1 Tax=Actinomadura atramentaria TaxID=1990 RepID=UPI0003A55456|nr:MMPL family transporter [Actinomadura atramentaria]
MSRVTAGIGGWSARHPWSAILLWVVLVAGCVAAGMGGGRDATTAELQTGQSATATELMDRAGLTDPAVENVLVTGGSAAERKAAATDLRTRMAALAPVATVSDPVPGADGAALLVPVVMKGDPDTAHERVGALLDTTADVQRAHPAVRVQETGAASIKSDFDDWLGKDLTKAAALSVPVTLVILLLAFGALVAAGLPVLLALSAVAGALGLWAAASHLVPDPGMVSDVIVLIGMAVGVDYSLFYLRRFREEKEAGKDAPDAIAVAARTSGHSVLVSGLAIVVAMTGLFLADDVVFASMATGAILVVAVTVVASLTVLPALLAKFGRAVDRPRVPLLWRLSRPGREPRLWPALLRPSVRHPFLMLLVGGAALVALAVPALDMAPKATLTGDFPDALPTIKVYDQVVRAYPSQDGSFDVVVRGGSEKLPQVRTALKDLVARTQRDPLFGGQGAAQIRVSADGSTAAVTVPTPYGTDSPDSRRALERLRGDYLPATAGRTGARYAVGGDLAASLDYADQLKEKLPLVLGYVLVLTSLMMVLAFRALLLALVTLLLNLLSAAASFGVLTLVFQHTWAEGLLGFKSTGHVVSWVPVLLFVVLSGLSMDYHVFVVSRIREDAAGGLGFKDAVVSGLSRTAGVVSSAAVVMVAVFAIFASLSFIELKQIGVGLAVAVALDATVVRAVLLPAALSALGRWTWWPSLRPRKLVSTAEYDVLERHY